VRLRIPLILTMVVIGSPLSSVAKAQSCPAVRSCAEQRLRAGLTVKFPPWRVAESRAELAARTIPSKWIRALIKSESIRVPIDVENAVIVGSLNLDSVVAKRKVSLINCRILGNASFAFATFSESANFTGTRFFRVANFNGTQAARDFRLTESEFQGDAFFQDLHVHESLNAQGAQFNGVADFSRAEIDKSAFFDRETDNRCAVFSGMAKFQGMDVRDSAVFKCSRFLADVTFENLKVGGSAFFDEGVEFKGKATFLLAHIRQNAVFLGAKFRQESHFDWARFDGAASFWDQKHSPTEFDGVVHFSSAVFGADAIFQDAYFAVFAGFDDVEFDGAADFSGAQFKGGVDFTGARLPRGALFSRTKFWGPANFSQIVADRDCKFGEAEFNNAAVFREAQARVVFFGEPSSAGLETPTVSSLSQTTKFEGPVDLRGFTYDRIYVNRRDLFKWIAPYDRQPYTQMEQALRKTGADDEADDVYVERRTVEGSRISFWPQPLGWLWDRSYKWIANYGILNWQLIVFAASLLIMGTTFFSQPGMVELKKADNKQEPLCYFLPVAPVCLAWHQALAFSFHEFVPLSLPIADKWIPSATGLQFKIPHTDRLLTLNPTLISTILRSAGWIIVPIAVAALSGLLRRTSP